MTSQHVIKNAIQNRSYSLMTGTLNVQIYNKPGYNFTKWLTQNLNVPTTLKL